MKNNVKIPWVAKWFILSQSQVLDKFQGLRNSYTDGIDQKRFVWIPGERSDRVLLVAHADTVWGKNPIYLDYYNDIIFSRSDARKTSFKKETRYAQGTTTETGIGIGADDRAGCAILWALKDLGHSLLITSGEEEGCVASKRIIDNKHWQSIISQHSFAVEFDRRGRNDIVFYDIATKKFAEYVQKETGFTPDTGFSTDIKFLCENICGVNMSVGYYREHSPEEKIIVSQWQNSLAIAKEWLSKPNLQKFELDRTNIYHKYPQYDSHYGGAYQDDSYSYKELPYHNKHSAPKPIINDSCELLDNKVIVCPKCQKNMTQEEWFYNIFICDNCREVI